MRTICQTKPKMGSSPPNRSYAPHGQPRASHRAASPARETQQTEDGMGRSQVEILAARVGTRGHMQSEIEVVSAQEVRNIRNPGSDAAPILNLGRFEREGLTGWAKNLDHRRWPGMRPEPGSCPPAAFTPPRGIAGPCTRQTRTRWADSPRGSTAPRRPPPFHSGCQRRSSMVWSIPHKPGASKRSRLPVRSAGVVAACTAIGEHPGAIALANSPSRFVSQPAVAKEEGEPHVRKHH